MFQTPVWNTFSFVIQYILGSRNINIDLYKVTKSMPCDQYRYWDKGVTVHMSIILEKVSSDHLTLLSLG